MRRRVADDRGIPTTFVIPAAVALVVASVGLRAWMLFPSWFLLDDFHFLDTGRIDRPTVDYLIEPYNGNLMPGGRVIAWVVAHTGLVNWTTVAISSLTFHAAAALAAVWMLVTLFGRRPMILVPLLVYLSSAMATPSLVWWSAALNQLPLHVSYFLAITAWVQYVRTRSFTWLFLTLAAVAGGLFFWVKAILILPVLAFLAVAYFARGSAWSRISSTIRRYPWALVLSSALAAGYLAVYVTHTPDQSNRFTPALAVELIGTMAGRAFGTTAVGGPWVWDNFAPPTAYAGPPDGAVTAAWIVITLVVVYLWLRRERTLRAWVMLVGYVAALVVLLLTSRAPSFGAGIGMELRYIADGLIVLVLALGLATMPVVGAVESSEPRADPLLARAAPGWLTGALVAVVAIGGIVSSVQYAHIWHTQNASEQYMLRVKAQLDARGPTDLAPQIAPEEVFSSLAAPANSTSYFLPLLSAQARFPDVSTALTMVSPQGDLRRARIDDVITSAPGPVKNCGWKVTSRTTTVPLSGNAFDFVWWIRIPYLASESSPLTITLGDTEVVTSTRSGLHDLYLRVEDTFDRITFSGIDEGVTVCLDTIEVGGPVPGDPL